MSHLLSLHGLAVNSLLQTLMFQFAWHHCSTPTTWECYNLTYTYILHMSKIKLRLSFLLRQSKQKTWLREVTSLAKILKFPCLRTRTSPAIQVTILVNDPGDLLKARDWTCVSCIAGRFFTTEPQGKPIILHVNIQYNFYEKSVSSDIVDSDVFLDYFFIFIALLSTIYCIKCSWDAISICSANYILAV